MARSDGVRKQEDPHTTQGYIKLRDKQTKLVKFMGPIKELYQILILEEKEGNYVYTFKENQEQENNNEIKAST